MERLLQKPDRLIGLVLIGNNLVNILASALATIVGMRLYGVLGVAIVTGVLTFAEVLLKTFAALSPERIAFPSSFLLVPLQMVMFPLVWLLSGITSLVQRLFGIRTNVHLSDAVSKDELRTTVRESQSQISRRNQDMLISVLVLEKGTVDDIMVPRNEIVGINDWKSIIRQLTHSPHGRIALYRRWLDDAIGMQRVREAYRLVTETKEFNKENLLRAADEIYLCPQAGPLNVQLVKFQRNQEKVGISGRRIR